MIKIVDRYIIQELLSPFIFGIISFSSILAGSTILIPLMQEAAKFDIPISQVIQLFVYQVPGIIVFTFPMSMLLATILVFGRMNTDLEIIAFRAAGINFFRLIIPVVAVGMLISLMTIWFNESIVPKANNSATNLLTVIKNKDKPTLKQNLNITEYDTEGKPSRIINIVEIDKGILKQATVLEYQKGELIRAIKATEGKWRDDGAWEFYKGTMHNFTLSDRRKAIVMDFEKEVINININPLDIKNREKQIEEMNAKELNNRIKLSKRTGQNYKNDLVRYHLKFAVPFASLIFSILGASIGLRPHRSTSAIGLGISLVIVILYYVLLGVGLGIAHIVPPIVAAWMPNLIVALAAVLLLKKVASQ
jgi:lipopolysaccharide export system permease protein